MFDLNYYQTKKQGLLKKYNIKREQFGNAIINMSADHSRELDEIGGEIVEISRLIQEMEDSSDTIVDKKKDEK